jgi:hypothetical protein
MDGPYFLAYGEACHFKGIGRFVRRAPRERRRRRHDALNGTTRGRAGRYADTANAESPDANWLRRLDTARGLERAHEVFPETVTALAAQTLRIVGIA